MKVFNDAATAAIMSNSAVVSGSVFIDCDPPVRVWGGNGNITIDGEVYTGIGDRGLAQATSAALGGSAQAVSLILSRVDPTLIADNFEPQHLQDAPTVLSRLILDSSGTQLLDYHVFTRGKVDLAPVEETPRGEATITLTIEGSARSLGRRGGRQRADADQRTVKPTDGGLKRVSNVAQKQLYWGGQPPANVATGTAAMIGSVLRSVMTNQ